MTITAVNDRDVLLRDSDTRNTDPTAGKYLTLTTTTPIFHVSSLGVGSPESITFTAIPVGISGDATFTITSGGTLSGTGNTRTLAFSDMQLDSVTITATLTVDGQTYITSQVITKVADGSSGTSGVATFVVVSTTSQVFSRATSAATFAPTSITLTATPYGGTATYQWQYWSGAAWTSISGATAATYAVASSAFTDARTFRVQATIGGVVYTDEMTLVQVTGGTNGVSAITGFLTNESATLAATAAGVVTDFSQGAGTFKVFEGVTDRTGTSVTYSVADQSGCTVAITTAGAYSVSAMSTDAATATLQAVYGGVTIQKVLSLAKAKVGAAGSTGNSVATAFLFKWATAQPSLPTGTSEFTWASGANTSYTGTDSWYISAAAAGGNPGTAGIQLWVVSKQLVVAAGTATSTVAYTTGAVLVAYAINGANGAPGIKSKVVTAYQWANGPAPTAVGSAIFTWAQNDYDNPPSGWTKNKTNAPALGYTMYEAGVSIVESSGAATSTVDWTTATIVGVAYMSTAGAQGTSGNSAVFAYSVIDGNTLNSTPASVTVDGTALPTTGTWGETRAWSATPGVPTAGQSLFQSNGIFNATTNKTTWGAPFLASLRVGSLSAVSTNTGSLTVGGTISSANGKFSVDVNGKVIMGDAEMRAADGTVILASSVPLNAAYAATGTLNSQQQWVDVSGTGRPADNASSDVVLVGTNVTVRGNSAVKTGGSDGSWDSSVYSRDSFTGGAYASAVVVNTTGSVMLALNGDASSSVGYQTLDYAIYLDAGAGIVRVFEFNSNPASFGAYEVGNVFAIVYDGSSVKYLKDGDVFYTSASWQSKVVGQVLFFDSSFATTGAALSGIRFGPMSSNAWESIGGSGKPQDNATVGAPAGTTVGGTEASVVASNAAAGKGAADAIPGINTSLSDKLTKSGNDIISGSLVLQSSQALLVGNTTNGVYYGSGGLVGKKAGVTTFAIAADGTATFAGTLSAATGSFAGTLAAGTTSTNSLSSLNSNLGAITAGSININSKFIVASDGSTTIQSATSGARTVISSSLIQVFDSGGNLRVRMGVW
jgi:hypothetical protein